MVHSCARPHTGNVAASGIWRRRGLRVALRSLGVLALLATVVVGRDDPARANTAVVFPHTASRIALTRDGGSLVLAWSPNSRWLLYRRMPHGMGPGGTLYLVSVDGRTRRRLSQDSVQDAVFLPDGRHVLYQRVSSPKVLILVRTDLQGREQRVYRVGEYLFIQRAIGGWAGLLPTLSSAILTSGHLLVEHLGVIADFNPLSGRLVRAGSRRFPIYMSHVVFAPDCVVSPDGRLVATFDGRVFEIRSGEQVLTVPHRAGIDAMAFGPDSRTLAYEGGGRNGSLGGHIWAVDVATARAWPLVKLGADYVGSFAWSPHGRFLSFVDIPDGAGVAPACHVIFVGRLGQDFRTMDPFSPPNGLGEIEAFWAPSGRAVAYARQLDPGQEQGQPRTDVLVAELAGPSG